MSGSIAVVGAGSLAGRELVERLRGSGLDDRLELIGVDEELATLAEVGGRLRAETPDLRAALADAAAIVVAASPTEEQLDRIQAAQDSLPVLDLTGSLDAPPLDARAGDRLRPGAWASPGAGPLVAASLVRAARRAGAEGTAVAVLLEPLSELGLEAVDEMHAQAVALLNFSEMPTAVLGGQAVHDLRSPGREGAARERRLRRELSALCDGGVSLLRVQSGAFHGSAVALRCEVAAAAWREALGAEPGVELAAEAAEASPVAAVRAGRCVVGRVDDDGAGGAWAWAAADGLAHGAVGNAVRLLAALGGS